MSDSFVVVALSLPMKQWSIDKVATELCKLLGEAVVAKFVEQVGPSLSSYHVLFMRHVVEVILLAN